MKHPKAHAGIALGPGEDCQSRVQRCSQPKISAQEVLTGHAEELSGSAKRSGKGKAAGHQPWTSVAGRSLAKVQVCSGSKAQSIPRPSACAALAGRSLPSLPHLNCSEHCLSHPKIVSKARSDLWVFCMQTSVCSSLREITAALRLSQPGKSSNSPQLAPMLPWLLRLRFCTCWQTIPAVRGAPASL